MLYTSLVYSIRKLPLILLTILIVSTFLIALKSILHNSRVLLFGSNSGDDDIKSILANPNEYIYYYVNLPLSYDYGSNVIPLTMTGLIAPHGDFLELGMGLYSTPILHRIATHRKQLLVSVDTNANWLNKFAFYNTTRHHRIYQLSSLDELMKYGLDRHWSLVLVDHTFAEERAKNAIAFASIARVVVVHDTELISEHAYKFEKQRMTSYFKYVCKFSLYMNEKRDRYTSTTLMSNFIDLSSLLRPAFHRVHTDYGHVSCDFSL